MTIETVIASNHEDIKEFIIDRFQSFYEEAMSQGMATMNPAGMIFLSGSWMLMKICWKSLLTTSMK